MTFLTTSVALIILLWSCAVAEHVILYWNVGWVENVNLDGLFTRRAIGINGFYPPPIIMINQTDSLTINFKNAFSDGRGTALHSHGMFFNNTGYFDGAASITQCPIPDGESIAYQPHNSPHSPAIRQEQWGTYWTHGHYDGQYVDGLRTPAIIHATNELYKYDDDYTIILADWYHREHHDLVVNELINVKNPLGNDPVPQSGLVYFAHTAKGATAEYLPGYNENATLFFEPGKTYRLRLINMAAISKFQFWIEGHEMSIIEADGVDVEEVPVDKIDLAVAQRYSVLVHARNDTSRNWPVHVNLDPVMFSKVPKSLQLNITSAIAYKEGNPMGSDRPTIYYDYFDDTALVPVISQPQLPADVSFVRSFDWNTFSNGKDYAFVNDTIFIPPLTPSLFTALSMPTNESKLPIAYGPNGNAIVVEHMKSFEIVLLNLGKLGHPFHLHGHQFQVVHRSQNFKSDDPAINPVKKEGQVNPLRRDTVQVPAGGSVSIRMVADNPGAWILHCHIDWHLAAGLAMVVIEAPEKIQENLQVPFYLFQQCQQQGLPVSGNAGGFQSLKDFGALPLAPTPLKSGCTIYTVVTILACAFAALLGNGTVILYSSRYSNDANEDEE
ncbi:putative iron transport multicopper oxidase [Meira miltonrushii]|uniref:Putative iron transport multicopper oxidase n=1 Tax=Meira miltonrushii TaxID=1280837 RepID=A0A316VJZ9_9BASI|nr:putative iron transport multicopper oxidase [Meira miltonrushii]PWN37840.1 putative iron transport multicopper oxidase [Meira miltonrushii]